MSLVFPQPLRNTAKPRLLAARTRYTVVMRDALKPDLASIASRTLQNYGGRAAAFWAGTRDHDVSQNLNALLAALPARPGLRILDLGCGPGRDLLALRALGHVPTGLDGCSEFVRMAREHSGCEVWEQSFFELALAPARFDGIFANASLFHVPRAILPRVLAELLQALVPGGVLFCSNPRAMAEEYEGWQGERYGTFLGVESWSELFVAAGFSYESHFLRPSDKPSAEQPWLAMVWRRPA